MKKTVNVMNALNDALVDAEAHSDSARSVIKGIEDERGIVV